MRNAHIVTIFIGICQLLEQASGQGGLIIIPASDVPTTIAPATSPIANVLIVNNPAVCQCTATTNCADGSGTLNPRIVNNVSPFLSNQWSTLGDLLKTVVVGPGLFQLTPVVCAAGQVYCCNLIVPNPVTTAPVTTAPITVAPPTCGTPVVIATTFVPAAGQASFAEYPWTVLIFRVADNALIGTGVLIDATTVLTAAHKVTPATQAVRVRLGEYILNSEVEPNRFVEIPVTVIRIHEAFNAVNLINDIAVLKLATPVDFVSNPHIRAICLPAAGAVYSNQRCWVAGFGASSFASNQYQTTMREVDLPILDGPTCQARFAATRLGAAFVFNQQSFICSGGEAGKDACTGDGGAGLVCLAGTQWFLAGLVSWGLDCGTTNVPGAYVNIPNYIAWITTNRV